MARLRLGEIRARICRRDIADEPVARIATLARIGDDFILRGMCDNRRQSARNEAEKSGFSEMVAAAGFDTRNLQVLSNQYPGGPLPDKGAELDKGRPLLLPLLGLRCVIFV
jgi:hypothetical protein